MSTLRFNDGMNIDTSGNYRIVRKSDGLYVVGHGYMEAAADMEEAREILADLQKTEVKE